MPNDITNPPFAPIGQVVFEESVLDLYEFHGHRYLTSRQIGVALGYERTDSIARLHQRHEAEFKPGWVAKLPIATETRGTQETLCFSFDGTNLVAMKAATPVGVRFRHFILDVLAGRARLILPGELPAAPAVLPAEVRSLPTSHEERAARLAQDVYEAVCHERPTVADIIEEMAVLHARIQELNDQKPGLYARARAEGLSPVQLREFVKLRFAAALGLVDHTRRRGHG